MKKRKSLGLEFEELFLPKEQLVKKITADESVYSLDEARSETKRLFDLVIEKARVADPTLEGAARAELQKQLSSLDGFEKRILKALKQKESVRLQQLQKILDSLFPGGEMQERHDNFFEHYLTFGDGLLDYLLEVFKSAGEKFSLRYGSFIWRLIQDRIAKLRQRPPCPHFLFSACLFFSCRLLQAPVLPSCC